MSDDLEIQRLKAQMLGDHVAMEFLKWLLANGIVFRQCQENSAAIDKYLKEKNLVFTLESCIEAYNELTKRGHRFLLDKLGPPVVAEEELPPLPEVPGMGEPQIFTVSDINNNNIMPPERYKKLYFGPHKIEFRARVEEIMRRAREEK
jgi:hypothetical protein